MTQTTARHDWMHIATNGQELFITVELLPGARALWSLSAPEPAGDNRAGRLLIGVGASDSFAGAIASARDLARRFDADVADLLERVGALVEQEPGVTTMAALRAALVEMTSAKFAKTGDADG